MKNKNFFQSKTYFIKVLPEKLQNWGTLENA